MVAARQEPSDNVLTLDPEDFTPRIARTVLRWDFTKEDRERLGELLAKNGAGKIDETERRELRAYVVLGETLDLLHAKAKLSLKHTAVVEKH